MKSHILTRALIENFAIRSQVRVDDVVQGTSYTANTENVAAHRDFYARIDWDGQRSQEVERSLEPIESVVPPLLREISDRWPLPPSLKSDVAEFVAVQTVRSPGLRAFDRLQSRRSFDEQRLRLLADRRSVDVAVKLEHLRSQQSIVDAPAFRHQRMLALIEKAASVYASMHWALLEFEQGSLGISDQPVVALPAGRTLYLPGSLNFDAGLLHAEEVRFPISPTSALLMSWADAPDARGEMDAEIAANLNAFSRAQTFRHWMYRLDTEPRLAEGHLPLIAEQVYSGFRHGAYQASRRWKVTNSNIQPRLGHDTTGYIEAVTVTATERPDEA